MDKEMTVEEALKSVKGSIYSNNFEESQLQYNDRSKIYDMQQKVLGTGFPPTAADLCMKYAENTESTTVLDLGAGTGNVGVCLRERNFVGQIDILDANMEMLYVAHKKGLNFRNVICHVVNADGDLLLPDASYEVVMCVSCFFANNFPTTCLKGIIKALKPGGSLIFSLRKGDKNQYAESVKASVDELESQGKVLHLESKEVQTYKSFTEWFSMFHVYKRL